MSREQAIYLGDGTAAATILRNQKINAGLQGSPVEWVGTVVGLLLGRKLDVTPEALRGSRTFARSFLSGLGYDPDTHELGRRHRPWPGLVVRSADGRPVRFVGEKELVGLLADSDFLSAFEEQNAA